VSTQWSYSGDPSSSTKDQVRFLIGDIDPKNPLLTDAEINFTIVDEGSPNEAAISCVQAIIARVARDLTESTKDGDKQKTKNLSDKLQNYKDLAVQLRLKRGRRLTGLGAGGISVSDKTARDQDPNRVKPNFTRELMDNPGLRETEFDGQETM